MKLWWLRGRGKLNYKKARIYFPVGLPGSGKSTLLEWVAEKHKKVIDFFGSRDSEGLGWCRSKKFDQQDILFVTGDSVELNGKWDTRKISKLTIADIEHYSLSLSVHAFYSNSDEEYDAMGRFAKVLERRICWKYPWYILIREAANFLYSRIRIVKSQSYAKAQFIQAVREMRHAGMSVGVDTVRWTAIDKEIRDLANYTFIKRMGVHGLPDDIKWVYRYAPPSWLMSLAPNKFCLICTNGPIAVGTFEEIPWHKKEEENILDILNLDPQYGELPEHLQPELALQKVKPSEHTCILRAYQELGSMVKAGVKIKRSSGTVHKHVNIHNNEVKTKGFCSRCEKVNSALQSDIISPV